MTLEVARAAPPALASTSAASSARGAFHRRVLLVERSPPPIRQLCRCAMGFRPAFTRLARARRARPEVRTQVVHPRRAGGPRAARRLLQSLRPASTTIEPFEPCAPDVRSPSRRACSQVASRGDVRVSARVSSVANRGVMGQGPQMLSPRAASFEKRSLAFEALPQPDRLGHPLSLARGDVGRWCRRRPTLG
jgi:hypothetical protein